MRIGQIAERVGINPKTIRFYESVGVMPEPARTSSGYRDYADEDLERLVGANRRRPRLHSVLDRRPIVGSIFSIQHPEYDPVVVDCDAEAPSVFLHRPPYIAERCLEAAGRYLGVKHITGVRYGG